MFNYSPCSRFFWYNDALVASDSISFAESFNWKLFLCLLLAWVAVYLCVFKGIKSSGKVYPIFISTHDMLYMGSMLFFSTYFALAVLKSPSRCCV